MNVKKRVMTLLVGACLAGSIVGCDKPAGDSKKPATAPPPGPAPAHTTEAK